MVGQICQGKMLSSFRTKKDYFNQKSSAKNSKGLLQGTEKDVKTVFEGKGNVSFYIPIFYEP